MKTTIKSLLLAAPLFLLIGCANLTTDQKAAQIQKISYDVAHIGSQAALAYNQGYRPGFQLAYDSLGVLSTNATLSIGDVTGVIQKLMAGGTNYPSIKELKSPQTQLEISAGTLILTDLTTGVTNPIVQNIYAHSVCVGFRDGFGDTLAVAERQQRIPPSSAQ